MAIKNWKISKFSVRLTVRSWSFRSLILSSVRPSVRRFVRLLVRPCARAAAEERGERPGNAVAGSSGRSGDSNFCRNLRNGHHLVRSSSRSALFLPLAIESTNGSSSNACCSKWIRSLLWAFVFGFPSLHPLLLLLLLILVALQSWGGPEKRDEPRETAAAMKNETTSCCSSPSCGASTPSFGTTT